MASESCQVSPPDRGKAAWSYLAGCFWIEGFTWGLPFSWGVFQKYHSTHSPISSNQNGLAAVGTSATGVLYLASVPVFAILQKWPFLRKYSSILGLVIITVALIAASFAEHVTDLLFTQGILYGMGGAMLYTPFVINLGEWFVERKGLAFGILWAGTGISSAIVPPIMEWGLSKYGFRTMLRAWAVGAVTITSPLIYFMKSRLPIPSKGSPLSSNLDCFVNSTFWILQLGNVIQGLGYFMPSIYLPTFAHAVGLSDMAGTIAISLLNCSSAAGAILTGILTDRIQLPVVLLLSGVVSTIGVFVFWSFATSEAVLYAFSFIYGISSGGYSATWTRCSTEVHNGAKRTEVGVLIGLFGAGRGFGSIISGPISERLLRLQLWKGESAGAYGTGYGILIVFTGITAALGGLGWTLRFKQRPVLEPVPPPTIILG